MYCVCVCVCVRVGRPGTHTKKVEKAFSFVVWLIFVICAVSILHTTTSLPCCIHRLAVVRSVHASVDLWSGPYTLAYLLAVVRSVHGNVDLLTFAKELPCYVRHITLPA